MAIDSGMDFGSKKSTGRSPSGSGRPRREAPVAASRAKGVSGNDFSDAKRAKGAKGESKSFDKRRAAQIAGVVALVCAIAAAVVFVASGLARDALRNEPYTADVETYDSGTNVAHVGAEDANNIDNSGATGFIDTGSGYGWRIPRLDSKSDKVVIRGAMRNMGDKRQDSVSVDFLLKNADGDVIGSAAAGTDGIDAGAVWEFEATSVDDVKSSDVSTFYLEKVQWGKDDKTGAAADANAVAEANTPAS